MNTRPFRVVKHGDVEFKVYEPETEEKSESNSAMFNAIVWGIPLCLVAMQYVGKYIL